jgi:hypothetical protein
MERLSVKTAARDGNFVEFVMGKAILGIKTIISSIISAEDHSKRDLNF